MKELSIKEAEVLCDVVLESALALGLDVETPAIQDSLEQ
jgi:hypothetical protein